MRVNLTKRDLVNLIYMQIGFSKQISENLIDEFFYLIISNLIKEKKLKISKFGTFFIKQIMDEAVFKKDQQGWINHLVLTKKI